MTPSERRQAEAAYTLRVLNCRATLRRLLECHGRIAVAEAVASLRLPALPEPEPKKPAEGSEVLSGRV